MSITIVKAKNGVDYITPSKKQTDPSKPRGYFRVEQSTEQFTPSGLLVVNTKSMLFSGEISKLEATLAKMRYQMQGSLYVQEIAESDLDKRPELKNRLNIKPELKTIPISDYTADEITEYEEAVEKLVKRTGANGVELRHNGERILRFTSYDPTSTKADELLAYTNIEEVSAFRIAEKNKTADLPTGD